MRYVWIWMLLVIDVIWLISSIVDIVKTVRYVKEHEQYDGIGDFVNCVIVYLKESTVGFIALHLFVLFVVSFIAWLNFKRGSAE